MMTRKAKELWEKEQERRRKKEHEVRLRERLSCLPHVKCDHNFPDAYRSQISPGD